MKNKEIELSGGFGMSLTMNKNAMDYYSKLTYEKQMKIVSYIKDNNTGFEAKNKIRNAINGLEKGNIDFLF